MIAALFARHRQLSRQLFRFGVIGATATLIHVLVVLVMVESDLLAPRSANLAGFAVSVGFNYLGNHRWTFGRAGRHAHHLSRFLPTALAGLLLSQSIVHVVVHMLIWDYRIALATIVVAVPSLTFALNRWWVFKAESAAQSSDIR